MNVDWLARLPAGMRRELYFGLQRAIGSRVAETWNEFQRWQKFSTAELDSAISTKLTRLLRHATEHSAYYRELGLAVPRNESGLHFLKQFPVLTREKIREHFSKIVTDSLRSEIPSPQSIPGQGYNWVIVRTGGTTGVPTTVVHDAPTRDWGRATRLFSAQQCGFPVGTPYFKLWGSEADLMQSRQTLPARVMQNLLGEIPLNAFRARENELRDHYSQLQRHPEIKHLMTYVDAAVSLASFIDDARLPRIPLRTIMACAGTVTPEWRSLLEKSFSAEVFDKYGSRECSDIACECRSHSGLHVYSPAVFVEIVDQNNQPCAPGQTGRLLVTILNNYSFPMIRYEIGDLAEAAENIPCNCGLPFPRIRSLKGREDDMLLTEDGTLLSSVFVRHFVGVSLNRHLIREWQLEQVGDTHYVFRYIPLKTDGLARNLSELETSFRTALGAGIRIEMVEVKEIPLSTTGKMRWIINRLESRRRQ